MPTLRRGRELEKDKARRYSSAANLAADIQRYLEDRPITAKPASTRYQLQKFARRHKALVASVGIVFLVLMAATVVSLREAFKATRAAETSEALNNFLQDDLLALARTMNVTQPYAAEVRKGRHIPHPMHWQGLAKLAGVAPAGH